MRTEHALDWSKTAQEISDQYEAGMIERDRYREALVDILANEEAYKRGDGLSAHIAKNALGIACLSLTREPEPTKPTGR